MVPFQGGSLLNANRNEFCQVVRDHLNTAKPDFFVIWILTRMILPE